MKISFIEPHLRLFGGIRRIIELANRLVGRGHEVTIYHSNGSPCTWKKVIARIKPAKQVLEELHDVVIFNDPTPLNYRLANKARARLKVNYVLELWEMNLLLRWNPKLYFPQPRYRRTMYLRRYLRQPYLVLVNASWLVDWLKHNLDLEATLLIGGVDTETFYPHEKKSPSDRIKILCSGDLRWRKGTNTIQAAFNIVKQQEPSAVLETYYGKGISQVEMAKVYSNADIFVDGQWQAGWNNPVAEAMACRTAVVCTDIGGVRDFAFHEKTALLVPPKESLALAEAVLRLIRDEPLRESLRENAYRHITTFDWDNSAQRLEEILTEEIERAPDSYNNLKANLFDSLEGAVLLFLRPIYGLVRMIRDAVDRDKSTEQAGQ